MLSHITVAHGDMNNTTSGSKLQSIQTPLSLSDLFSGQQVIHYSASVTWVHYTTSNMVCTLITHRSSKCRLQHEGTFVCKGYRKHEANDGISLGLFAQVLVDGTTGVESQAPPSSMFSALRQGIPATWVDTYDIAIPFGDRRGAGYDSVWTFDLDQDKLIQTRPGGSFSAPLSLARERELTVQDFSPLTLPSPPVPSAHNFIAPYWELQIGDLYRERAFLGRLLQDFAYTWRHLFRRQQNRLTFLRLAAAIVWISSLDFVVTERTGFDHSPGGPYAWASDLPQWPYPTSDFIKVGDTWFALFQDPNEGLHEIRRHYNYQISDQGRSRDYNTMYALLSLHHIVLIRAKPDSMLEFTRPEALFNGEDPPSRRAIDLLLWVAKTPQQPSTLNRLPMDLQDHTLWSTSFSTVAAAKIGCDISLGSPFSWHDGNRILELESCKRKRFETSPVESLIQFGPSMSAVSYKPEPQPQ